MSSPQGVGASLRRKEDARHLFGRGQFTADLKFPDALEVAFVRSPLAHAKIIAVEPPPNAGGRFFTAADFCNLKGIRSVPRIPGFKPSLYHPLAREKVRFVGEIIAA